uniref:Meg domain-containing protein n=1 Tax=Triticum urartu TaxID=4572 RepID=A0A8R7Q0M3_TRIUA
MDRHTNHTRAPAMLLPLLFLVCFALHAQCRIIEGMENDKINLPTGLCIHSKGCSGNCCYLCLVLEDCFVSMEECKKACQKDTPAIFNHTSPSI